MASVQALFYIHQVRFGGLKRDSRPDRVLEGSDSDDEEISEQRIERASRRPRENRLRTDEIDSTTESEDVPAMENRACQQTAAKRQRRVDSDLPQNTVLKATAKSGALPPRARHPPRAGGSVRKHRRQTGELTTQCRVRTPETAQTQPQATVDFSAEAANPGGIRNRIDPDSRKRSSCSYKIYDTDDPDARQSKRRRQPEQTGGGEAMLWTRWRQVAEPRRRRT